MKRAVLESLRLMQTALPVPPTGKLVLCYHLVGAGSGTEVDSALDAFRRQLDWLLARTEVIPLTRLSASARPAVALTFDDAFRNFSEVVWPELRTRSLPATLFVPTGFVDGEVGSPLSGCSLPPCSWSELRAMVEEGLALGSHTRTHRDLRTLSDTEIEEELVHANRRIETETGATASTFCYPQAKWDRRVERVVRRHHELSVIGSGWHVRGACSPVPRIPVRRDLTELEPLFRRGLWLEEWVANRVRHARPHRSRQAW